MSLKDFKILSKLGKLNNLLNNDYLGEGAYSSVYKI